MGYIHLDLLRNVHGQTLDLQLAGDEIHDPALGLDPHRHAPQLHVDLDRQDLVEGHFVEVGVQEAALDGLALELLQDDLAAFALQVQLEEGVLALGAAQDGPDLLGGDGHGHRLLARRVEHARHEAPGAQAPVGVLSGIGAALGRDHNLRHGFRTPWKI